MEHFELFGGKFFAKREAKKRLLALAGRQTTLDRKDLEFLLNGLLEQADGKRTLEWEGDHTLAGDLKVTPYQKWVDDNGIAAIICFGNLTIEGDLLNDHPNYSPLLIVAGDLRVRNLLKGGLPLFVFGNLVASGYFVTEYNDGPLRVGGDLVAAGYMPRCRDFPEGKGHVIAGSVRARTFDMRPPADIARKHHRATFVPEVISDGWLDPGLVLEREHAGLPVWKDQPDPILPDEPVEPPPMPAVWAMDPTDLGNLSPVPEVGDRLCQWIVDTTPDTRGLQPGKDFAEYAQYLFEDRQDGQVLTLPPGTRLEGDLEFDWETDWVRRNRIVALICEGDLTIDGDVLNRELDSGPMLLVGGKLRVRNLIKGGSRVIVIGDLEASGLVVCEYNHGVFRVGGDLSAQAYFVLDQSCWVCGAIHAPVLNDRDVDMREEVVPELFPTEDDAAPNVDWLWGRQRAGLPILKSEAEP